jgi:hypothetical protein
MSNTAVTNVTLSAYGTEAEFASTAATAEGANAAEVFDNTPTKRGEKLLIGIVNGAADQGAVAWSIAAGTLFAGVSAKTGSVAQGKTEVVQIETGKHLKSGKVEITLTPATGKILKTNHAAAIYAIEMV